MKRQRVIQIGLAATVAVVIVAIVVAVSVSSSSSNKSPSSFAASGKQAEALMQGIPQSGITLGNPNAPVTVDEFIDLQCPFCKQFALDSYPQLIPQYVRTGKIKLVLHILQFIGPDSVVAAEAGAAAAQQNKLFQFVDTFYHQQQEENSGYITPTFINNIYNAVGINASQANSFASSSAAAAPLEQANALSTQYQVQSTPAFVVGKTGGPLKNINADSTSLPYLLSFINKLLSQS